jgi:hypothetical protein
MLNEDINKIIFKIEEIEKKYMYNKLIESDSSDDTPPNSP